MNEILIIEDEKILGKNISRFMEMEGWSAHWSKSGTEGLALFFKESPDVVLLDLNLPDLHGLDILKQIRQHDTLTPVVIITAYGSIESVKQAMKLGATDYLTKPVDLKNLSYALDRVIGDNQLKKQIQFYSKSWSYQEPRSFIGHSPAITEVKRQLSRVVECMQDTRSIVNVMISGDIGTGKNTAARFLHMSGPVKDGPFVELYCPHLEHDEQTVTILGQKKPIHIVGLAEVADQGTLFLDQVNHLSEDCQFKLRSLVQKRLFNRLGDDRQRVTECLLITTTVSSWDIENQEKEWDKGFYQGISKLHVRMPALKDRETDILDLAQYFSSHFSIKYRLPERVFTEDAQKHMLKYSWPGNILEMQNVIERLYLLHDEETIDESLIRKQLTPVGQAERFMVPPQGMDYPEFEKEILLQALEISRFSIPRAAVLLNLSTSRLSARLQNYGIKTGRRTSDEIYHESKT